jgi:hypothetical protein
MIRQPALLFCLLLLPGILFAGGRREPESQTDATFRQRIAVALPGPGAGPAELELRFGAGTLSIGPGSGRLLVEGEAVYNNELFQPTQRREAKRVILSAGDGRLELKEFIELWESVRDHLNRWDLRLAAVPMDLVLDLGACSTSLDLGGLPLRRLRISQGLADLALEFGSPNPSEMQELVFFGGASRSTLKGLANANAGRIECRGGAGEFILDFSGRLRRDLFVKLEAGAGRVTLSVPEETSVEVESHTGLAVVDFRGTWNRPSGRQYIHQGTKAGPRITVDAAVLAGSLRLWAGDGNEQQ